MGNMEKGLEKQYSIESSELGDLKALDQVRHELDDLKAEFSVVEPLSPEQEGINYNDEYNDTYGTLSSVGNFNQRRIYQTVLGSQSEV